MSVFGAIMTGIGIISMLGTIGMSGKDAAQNSDQIRENIMQMASKSDTLKKQFDSIISGSSKLTAELQAEMTKNLDDLDVLSKSTKVEKEKFAQKFKTMQMIGILFVVGIFFLLLMKRFGIFESIQNTLMFPFQ